MAKKRRKSRLAIWNDIIIVAFAIISIILLALELQGDLSPFQNNALHLIDFSIAIFFFGDFLIRFRRNLNKGRFLLFHWWELLACIPVTNTVTQALRGLKALRLIELVAVVRVSSRLEMTGEIFGGLSEHPYVIETISTVLAIIFSGAIAFFAIEYGHNPKIHSLWDAFWWAASTMTTTGYGDIYPITTLGRLLGISLMFIGLVSAALLTSVMVRYFGLRRRS